MELQSMHIDIGSEFLCSIEMKFMPIRRIKILRGAYWP